MMHSEALTHYNVHMSRVTESTIVVEDIDAAILLVGAPGQLLGMDAAGAARRVAMIEAIDDLNANVRGSDNVRLAVALINLIVAQRDLGIGL